MIQFSCPCGNVLFFENSACVQCKAEVGYDPAANAFVQLTGDGSFVRCANGAQYGVCNWVVPATGDHPLCPACQLNHTIPDLSIAGNLDSWHRLESAKRRALYTLHRLGFHPVSKAVASDGIAFDFLLPTPTQRVMTGHENGVITINLLEANDPYRENVRTTLGETYRTVVGHFRHEFGHYYWDRFFQNRPPDDPLFLAWRALFGDESVDYNTALAHYHAQGAPPNWPLAYISAYATAHPWEDWAETWAQYLQILDGTETARTFGWDIDHVAIPFTPLELEQSENAPEQPCDAAFLETVNGWAKLAPAFNEISASLGHPNLYPFVFSEPAVRKLCFVHSVIKAEGGGGRGEESAEMASRGQ
jgi:hypothetical protein